MALDHKQEEVIDDAIKKLHELKSQTETGADAGAISQEYSQTITEVNAAIGDLLQEIKEGLDEKYKENNSVKTKNLKPCGIMDRQPKYSQADIVTAQGVVEDIMAEVKADPINYSKMRDISGKGKAGAGLGKERVTINVLEIQTEPWWLTELETELNLFKRRGKTKSYYDPLELMRGIPAKEREKKLVKEKTLWILLDVSGSMFGYSYKGRSLLELLASYIPLIAGKFEGELWQVDYGAPQKITKLEDLKGDEIKTMELKGGGGTNFDEVFKVLNKKKEKMQEELGGEVDFMTVLFTDAEVEWNQNVMPKNLIVVTVPEGESSLPDFDEEKNQKAIIIDIDPE